MRRIVVISDTQIPYDHPHAVSALLGFIHDTKPDEVVHIGDLMDYPQPSRWTQGTREQFAGSVQADSRRGRGFLTALRSGYDGPVSLIGSNHDERPARKLAQAAPELAEGDEFHIRTLLDLADHGVDFHEKFYNLAPGWTATHGHLDIGLSPIPGRTALNAALKFGVSVVMGHTHRLGYMHKATGYAGGRRTSLWGLEVGHLMDIRKASYLKSGAANWALGFGVLYVDGAEVTPFPVRVSTSGSFSFEGETWSPRPGVRF